MCGRLNITDNDGVRALVDSFGISVWPEHRHFGRFKRATDTIDIVREKDGQRRMENAIWWLLLEPTETGFKPSKYTSFNTRYDKLNVPRSAGYRSFRESRCIIPAAGFGETEYENKKPKHYYDFEPTEGGMAFGGLYREWIYKDTGEHAISCSVITLPPHEKLKHIHSKAMPLILPRDDSIITAWLDERQTSVDLFANLLMPHIPYELKAWPIDKPSQHNSVGDIVVIDADQISYIN